MATGRGVGADIINLSFGMLYETPALKAAPKRADKAGVVVVATAGNQGSKDEQYPAATKEVLSVAAYDPAPARWPASVPGAAGSMSRRPGWSDQRTTGGTLGDLVDLGEAIDRLR